jgi:hypothetical protein
MRSSKGVEVDRFYGVEEFPLIEDTKDVSGDKTTKRIAGNGEFGHSFVRVLLEILYVCENLGSHQMRISRAPP